MMITASQSGPRRNIKPWEPFHENKGTSGQNTNQVFFATQKNRVWSAGTRLWTKEGMDIDINTHKYLAIILKIKNVCLFIKCKKNYNF